LIPAIPCRVVDIGAGTGRDAAGFAALGHSVLTAELRTRAMGLHPSPQIEWLDDSLPELAQLAARDEKFDVVMLTAVWMHLDERQRRAAMPKVASLVQQGGLLSLTLRHGPVPPGRRMFEVTAQETEQLASLEGLSLLFKQDGQGDGLRRNGVSWTRLAFSKTEKPA
jgi:SAM-dependent methyltransferase